MKTGPGAWFVKTGCFVCHSISALGVKSPAQIGPDLSTAVEDTQARFGRTVDDFPARADRHDGGRSFAADHSHAAGKSNCGSETPRSLRGVPTSESRGGEDRRRGASLSTRTCKKERTS